MDQNQRIRLSLYVAEWQQKTRNMLTELQADDDVHEVITALGMCEAAARRWHMREAVDGGKIPMPVIEDYDETCADMFDE